MSKIELLNGDSYELIKTIPDKSIDLIYVDIPYLYDKHGCSKKSALSKRIDNVQNHQLAKIKDGIDYQILDEFCRVMKYIYIYIWCSKEQILDLMEYFVKEKQCSFNILVWCKTNPTPATNGTYLPDIEYCLVFKEKGSPRYNDGYDLKSKWYVSAINKKDKDLYKHPTIKPLNLVKRHIKHSSNEGDTILDCFMGSGTTGVACKELNRNFIGIEIDPTYVKIAQDRINGITADGQLSIFSDIDNSEQESLF